MPRKHEALEPDLAALRREIVRRVADHALTMVQCAIDAVEEEGQYQTMKYLFEMVGIHPAVAGGEDDAHDSLAEILLSQLGIGSGSRPKDPDQ